MGYSITTAVFRTLLTPFSYLGVFGNPVKSVIDWGVPLIFAFSLTLAFALAEEHAVVFGSYGYVPEVGSLISILPGFYIAALAAIATFDRPSMDEPITKPTPQKHILRDGKKIKISLTRRHFLASLFAFLVAESILIILICLVTNSFVHSIAAIVPTVARTPMLIAFLFFLNFLLGQLLACTFFGLYYLGERLHLNR